MNQAAPPYFGWAAPRQLGERCPTCKRQTRRRETTFPLPVVLVLPCSRVELPGIGRPLDDTRAIPKVPCRRCGRGNRTLEKWTKLANRRR